MIEKKKITLNVNISDDFRLFADENHVRSIVRNLLSNAIKFTPNEGEINISANKKANFVEFTITDTGIGIPQDEIPQLFILPTIQKATTGEKGTGLGLNLCKELIEQNAGSISVNSEYHKGTSFVVRLMMGK